MLVVTVENARYLAVRPDADGNGPPTVFCEVWCEGVHHASGENREVRRHRTLTLPTNEAGQWPAQEASGSAATPRGACLQEDQKSTAKFSMGIEGRSIATTTLHFNLFHCGDGADTPLVSMGAACVESATLCINLFPSVKSAFQQLQHASVQNTTAATARRAAGSKQRAVVLRSQGAKCCEVALQLCLLSDLRLIVGGAPRVSGLPGQRNARRPSTAYLIEISLKQATLGGGPPLVCRFKNRMPKIPVKPTTLSPGSSLGSAAAEMIQFDPTKDIFVFALTEATMHELAGRGSLAGAVMLKIELVSMAVRITPARSMVEVFQDGHTVQSVIGSAALGASQISRLALRAEGGVTGGLAQSAVAEDGRRHHTARPSKAGIRATAQAAFELEHCKHLVALFSKATKGHPAGHLQSEADLADFKKLLASKPHYVLDSITPKFMRAWSRPIKFGQVAVWWNSRGFKAVHHETRRVVKLFHTHTPNSSDTISKAGLEPLCRSLKVSPEAPLYDQQLRQSLQSRGSIQLLDFLQWWFAHWDAESSRLDKMTIMAPPDLLAVRATIEDEA